VQSELEKKINVKSTLALESSQSEESLQPEEAWTVVSYGQHSLSTGRKSASKRKAPTQLKGACDSRSNLNNPKVVPDDKDVHAGSNLSHPNALNFFTKRKKSETTTTTPTTPVVPVTTAAQAPAPAPAPSPATTGITEVTETTSSKEAEGGPVSQTSGL